MVSIVLITTEEALERNGFWNCLDSLWASEELEPFEEVHDGPFSKPVSRDYYYAMYPDIPRSESEEENSITVNGFISKHREWTAKVGRRRYDARRRHSSGSMISANSNISENRASRRVTSLVEKCGAKEKLRNEENDERIRAFFNRLLESIPPPPVEDLPETPVNVKFCSIIEPIFDEEFDVDLPDYKGFEMDKLRVPQRSDIPPGTSTMKKAKKRVSFSLESINAAEAANPWYESIYGVSGLIEESEINDVADNHANKRNKTEFVEENFDVDFPNYEDFEMEKMREPKSSDILPGTSTMKKNKKRVNPSLQSSNAAEVVNSWDETDEHANKRNKNEFVEENFNVDLPNYEDFEMDKMRKPQSSDILPGTSTMKKTKKPVSFSLESSTAAEVANSWYETIYGVSELIEKSEVNNEVEEPVNTTKNNENVENVSTSSWISVDNSKVTSEVFKRFASWSDLVNFCNADSSSESSVEPMEEIISQSQCVDTVMSDVTEDDEASAYAKFAVYKIYKTLQIENGMTDSSTLKRLDRADEQNRLSDNNLENGTVFESMYRIAPTDSLDQSPPENELQKNSDRVLSEHELRVQRSLQKLNVPEWYKNAPAPREGFLLRKRLSDASASAGRWGGLNSKTTSLGSLGAAGQPPLPPAPQLSPHTTSFGRWSTSRLNSNQTSPCSSTRSSIRGTSPLCSPSTRSSFSARQPYLGWRSQERLNSTPRTPHERLASSLLQQTAVSAASTKASEEIQSSIKEVTSAIVHYVSALEPANGDIDRQPSPRSSQKFFWLESSFVGTKPLESPQTPTVVSEALPPPHPRPPSSLRLDHRATPDWQEPQRSMLLGTTRPSPGSTTLEDVLDSLLGLPSQPTRIPTPQPSPRKATSPYYLMGGKSPRYELLASSGHSSASPASRFISTPSEEPSSFTDPSPDHDRPGKDSVDNLASTMQESRRPRSAQSEHSRRRSEPFAQASASLDRRTSLDAASLRPAESHMIHHDSRASLQTENSTDDPFIKCKYPKCTARAALADAKRHYKTCHNCTTMYCSKECRRAHWEKHRKVCLHSRASALCRQIISAAKEDADALHQVSSAAYKGYLTLGRGVVKVFFTSPEAAEKFTTHGYQYLSEPEYVRWTSLLPNEMGVDLYSEVVKLCKSYNPETRVILYVAVCIISEVPTKGAVKWERQMVSRCAKLRLSKAVSSAIQEQNRRRQRRDSKSTPEDRETLILTSKLENAGEKNAATAHKFREICFQNILKQLESRGVVLKKHFPEVYSRLTAYVDGTSDRFIPMTIYPKDVTSGRSFMCVIMPDSEVESGTPVDGKVTTVDVGVDRSRYQLSTPM